MKPYPDPLTLPSAPGAGLLPDVYQQLGAITRELHDALEQLGVMPRLQLAADGLPDARSRLSYIASKTAEAADKVLTSVDIAKAEQSGIAALVHRFAAGLAAGPPDDARRAVDAAALAAFVAEIDARTRSVDAHLTDIMMAQDFHDLTGQVVAKVVSLAADLEDSLLTLLMRSVPPQQRQKLAVNGALAGALAGPVVDAAGRSDVVANQREVDELLASLGF